MDPAAAPPSVTPSSAAKLGTRVSPAHLHLLSVLGRKHREFGLNEDRVFSFSFPLDPAPLFCAHAPSSPAAAVSQQASHGQPANQSSTCHCSSHLSDFYETTLVAPNLLCTDACTVAADAAQNSQSTASSGLTYVHVACLIDGHGARPRYNPSPEDIRDSCDGLYATPGEWFVALARLEIPAIIRRICSLDPILVDQYLCRPEDATIVSPSHGGDATSNARPKKHGPPFANAEEYLNALEHLFCHTREIINDHLGAMQPRLCHGAGSTMCAAVSIYDKLFCINIGDSCMMMMSEPNADILCTWSNRPVVEPACGRVPMGLRNLANVSFPSTVLALKFPCSYEDTLVDFPSKVREGQHWSIVQRDYQYVLPNLKPNRAANTLCSPYSNKNLRMVNTLGNLGHKTVLIPRTTVYSFSTLAIPEFTLVLVTDGIKDMFSARELAILHSCKNGYALIRALYELMEIDELSVHYHDFLQAAPPSAPKQSKIPTPQLQQQKSANSSPHHGERHKTNSDKSSIVTQIGKFLSSPNLSFGQNQDNESRISPAASPAPSENNQGDASKLHSHISEPNVHFSAASSPRGSVYASPQVQPRQSPPLQQGKTPNSRGESPSQTPTMRAISPPCANAIQNGLRFVSPTSETLRKLLSRYATMHAGETRGVLDRASHESIEALISLFADDASKPTCETAVSTVDPILRSPRGDGLQTNAFCAAVDFSSQQCPASLETLRSCAAMIHIARLRGALDDISSVIWRFS